MFDPDVEKGLLERLRRGPSASSVPGSLPVLFFGDILRAKAATVGLNPSIREYLDEKGLELTGDERRFETLSSLGAEDRMSLTDEKAWRAIGGMRGYYQGNVYAGWFSRMGRVLEGGGHDYKRDAVHLDLVQEATDPTWSALGRANREEHDALREQDLPFLRWLIETFPLRLLLADGKTALNGVAEITGADLVPVDRLGKLDVYAGTAYLGDREVMVGGWNLTLARGGLSAEQDRRLGKMIGDALGYEP